MPRHAWAAFGLAIASGAAVAQGVALAGQMGQRALLIIDGQPHTLAVGESARGVRFVQWQGELAQIERDGAISLLRLGAAQVGAAPAPAAGAREIVISASSGGHFITSGAINGRAARFMVDTGATVVALSRADAERFGIDWRQGEPGMTQTANGAVAVHRIMLARVRVGEVELAQVAAVIVPAAMPHVLLGNSFLSRLQMRRDNDVMRLELRP